MPVWDFEFTKNFYLAQGRFEGKCMGRREAARNIILGLCTKRFGPPSAKIKKLVLSLAGRELDEVLDRILMAKSWEHLVITVR